MEIQEEVILKFKEVCGSYSIDEEKSSYWLEEILLKYSEEHRRYHTLTHLTALFHLLDEYSHDIKDRKAVILAILFHDIIYDPKSSRNEEGKSIIVYFPYNMIFL